MRRIAALGALAVMSTACTWALPAAVNNCRALYHRGKLAEAHACDTALLQSSDALTRAEGYWGVFQWDDANVEFRAALKNQPNSTEIRQEWGLFFLDHYQPGDAAKLFEEVIELDAKNAPAYLGLARAAAVGYSEKAPEFAKKALEFDPKLFQAHELLASIALEDNDPKLASGEAQKALAISGDALDGMAVLASMDALDGKPQSEWMDRILKIDPAYGEAYATGAHFFEINRRYEEAIDRYRKALDLNPDLWDARTQLGLNLMRLGYESEAKQQLARCWDTHYRPAEVSNSMMLLDTLGDYETFKTGTTELMLNKKEAGLLRPYIEPMMQRAIATYERKYKMKLPGPVKLEVYPNHEDFVVRTLGLPGQGGLLGVTFGLVVAMDSPSARPPGEFNWASTMWHELSHVYILTATNHLVPRWFTEGLAVHEEGAASPDWGDRMTPDIVAAVKDKKLLPVLQLDRGFVRPQFPNQVIVSYFEAEKMLDFISKKWGDDAILGMVHSYADRKSTADAIQDNLHISPAEFDSEFTAWLNEQIGNTVQHFDDWKKGVKQGYDDFAAGKTDDAIREGLAVRDYYPDYIGALSVYELLGKAYLAKNDKPDAIKQLERYRDVGGTNVDTLKKLGQLEQESGNATQAETTYKKLDYVYPEDSDIHQRFGGLLLASGNASSAVTEYQSVLQLNPTDAAESHYNLAKALKAANRVTEAKDQAFMALETAPDYKPAQQLYLQLSQ